MTPRTRWTARRLLSVIGMGVALALPDQDIHAQPAPAAGAAPVQLTLSDAVRRALGESEEVRLAESQVQEARNQVDASRASLYPQINGDLSYQRTLRSPVNTGGGFDLPDSLSFSPDTTASLAERIRYLERRTPTAGLAALGSLFSDLPFGQKNTYVGRLGITQKVFDGAAFAGLQIAREFTRRVEDQASEQRLSLALSVVEAYYGAVLADRLATIVDLSANQLEQQLAQVRLIRSAGNASDLDVLRVEVERQNVEPQRVTALNQRDVALLNLKRLINVPLTQPVALIDALDAAPFAPVPDERLAAIIAEAQARRATISAAERQVRIRQQQVEVARAAYLPTVSVSANFGKQALPSDLIPGAGEFRDDWNAGITVRIPLFDGGRRRADVSVAAVQLRRSELELAQLREAVSVDVARQRGELQRAAVLIRAREQTTAQAQRVYELTTLSYERGLQTPLQLADARLQLQQARANEAQALHDYHVALARLMRAAGQPEGTLVTAVAPGAR